MRYPLFLAVFLVLLGCDDAADTPPEVIRPIAWTAVQPFGLEPVPQVLISIFSVTSTTLSLFFNMAKISSLQLSGKESWQLSSFVAMLGLYSTITSFPLEIRRNLTSFSFKSL